VGSAGLGSLVLAFVIGPRIRGEAGRLDLHTLGDYLEDRYGAGVRAIVTALLWVGTLAILAGQLIALAWVLNVVAGIPKLIGCLVGGLVMTTYFVAGGLLSSAWINLVQLAVLLGGFAVAIPLLLAQAGGITGLASRATPVAPDYWSFWHGGASGWHYLALLGPAFFVSPGLLQKIFGGRDERAVRVGTAWNAVGLLAFAIVPPLFGIIARALHPTLPHHELALPTLLKQNLPPVLGSLGLAALFSAEVSTADAILFMLATSLSRDLYRRFLNPLASDAQVLRVARGAAICGAGLGLLVAIVSPSVIGVLSVFYTLLSVSLFVPVVAGLYTRRMGTPEALAAILGGIVAVVAVRLSPGLVAGTGLSAAAVGLMVSVLAATVALAVRPLVRA
jgi:SSS family solute:Na+ symporter